MDDSYGAMALDSVAYTNLCRITAQCIRILAFGRVGTIRKFFIMAERPRNQWGTFETVHSSVLRVEPERPDHAKDNENAHAAILGMISHSAIHLILVQLSHHHTGF